MGRFARALGLLGVAILAGGLVADVAAARGRGKHGHGPPPIDRVLERHADRLGLDDALRARIRGLAREGHDAAESHFEELHELHDGLRELLSADSPDEEAVMRQAERIGAVKTELKKQRLRTMLAIRSLLTPEQRRELVRIHEEMREEWREKRERRHGRDWREDDPEE